MKQLAQIIITIPGKQYAFYWLSLLKYGYNTVYYGGSLTLLPTLTLLNAVRLFIAREHVLFLSAYCQINYLAFATCQTGE